MPPWASLARAATTITAAAAAATPTLPGVGFLPALDPEGVVTCHFLFLSHRGPASRCSPRKEFFLCITHLVILSFFCVIAYLLACYTFPQHHRVA